ncbi:MAG: L-fucose:H+ symporter permease [Bacteroidales bacterium]|nr:L-fucose:H+ symporter permease [Bacteroidales bacterium]
MKTISRKHILPFVLVTLCFALWGFANDITNPMVKAFSKIFRMSVTDGALVQLAFYGGYFCMALPAALFIRKFSYKAGLLMGLGLYAVGAFLFFPAQIIGSYYPFLLAYFVLTCGLSFLETSANPYILSMGDAETATRRLNLAQAFNPIGSLVGMFVAMNFIQSRLNPMDTAARAQLGNAEFEAMKSADLAVLSRPYVFIGIVLLVMFLLFVFLLPQKEKHLNLEDAGMQTENTSFKETLRRLWNNKRYRYGVVAQFFYVGVQIMCWTFIIQYGTQIFMAEGMGEQAAEILAQKFNIVAMLVFCISRFICTFLMKYIRPHKLLSVLGMIGIILLGIVIFVGGRTGMGCLVGVSACMSLMFPTIYGISLQGIGEDAKLGAAGLVMAILGGSILPPLQAMVIDGNGLGDISSVNLSFFLPMLCFAVVVIYANFVPRFCRK